MLICINRAGVETNLAALFVRRQNGCGGIALVESISFPDLDRAAHRLLPRRGLLFALRDRLLVLMAHHGGGADRMPVLRAAHLHHTAHVFPYTLYANSAPRNVPGPVPPLVHRARKSTRIHSSNKFATSITV